MRAKKLRSREQTFIKSNEKPVKQSLNFGKYIYLFILAVIIISLFKWIGEGLFFVKGIGFLEAETILVEATSPGRILEIKCSIDDTISTDTPLVMLDNTMVYDTQGGQQSNYTSFYTNERRIIETESKISFLKQKIAHQKDVLRKQKSNYVNAQNLYYASAITRTQFSEREDRVKKTELELNALQIDFSAELKKLKSYRTQQRTVGNASYSSNSTNLNSMLFTATAGVVSEIFKTKGEVVRMGEPIVEIINRDKKIIRAYFTENNEKTIEKNDKVTIDFENGDSSVGVVNKIYPSTAPQPPEIKHKFGKFRRFIIAEISPAEKLTASRVFETQVKVTAKKKWIKRIIELF